jgi:hypothetical protein
MKRKILQICTLLGLALILAVVSTEAQTIIQYKANIPFDFNIGKKTYQSGDYIIYVKSLNQLSAMLSVKNAKTLDLRKIVVLMNGSRSRADKTVLMFDRYADQYVLTQMVSPGFGLSAPKSKVKKRTAKKIKQPQESVAIVLVKRNEDIE